jgi:hypothetical protein
MALQAGKRYNVEIVSANLTESQNTGSPGIEVHFECEEGTIDHTFWLTEKSKKYVKKDLKTLGLEEDSLESTTFMDNIDTAMSGQKCSILTYEDEYNGKKKLKVKYINKPLVAGGEAPLAKRAASFFSGKPDAPNAAVQITDDDVPF